MNQVVNDFLPFNLVQFQVTKIWRDYFRQAKFHYIKLFLLADKFATVISSFLTSNKCRCNGSVKLNIPESLNYTIHQFSIDYFSDHEDQKFIWLISYILGSI